MEKSKSFKVDARLILELGRNSIRDHTTALAELVKNSYDADAEQVTVEIYIDGDKSFIRVADDGFGMDEQVIDDNWLRIGFSEKKKKQKSRKGRIKAGNKGIGRIAADRIGSEFSLITKAEGNKTIGLKVDWSEFEKAGTELSDINIPIIVNPILNVPTIKGSHPKHGTEVIIKNLREAWRDSDLEDLERELSTLISPFNPTKDFQLTIKSNINKKYNNRQIGSTFVDMSEIEVEIEYDGISSSLMYYIHDKSKKKPLLKTVKINQLVQRPNRKEDTPRLYCGPFRTKLFFIKRNFSRAVLKKYSFSKMGDFKSMIDNYLGVKVYRDLIAVKPYGFTDDVFSDWLGLGERKARNPAGVSRKDYKVSPNQIMGAVYITGKNNPLLISTSARDGLVNNDAFRDLRLATLRGIEILESYRYKSTKGNPDDDPEVLEIGEIHENVKHVGNQLKELEDELDKESSKQNTSEAGQSLIKKMKDRISKVTEEVDAIGNNVTEKEEQFKEILNENRVLGGLATLGITAAVFGHETQGALDNLDTASDNARRLIKRERYKMALSELQKVNKHSKFIAGWGSFALSRIDLEKRTNPRNTRIDKLVVDCVEELRLAFNKLGIIIDTEKVEKFMAKVYIMDIETIIFNLLSNAIKACKQITNNRKIKIELHAKTEKKGKKKEKGFNLVVADSGDGIAEEFLEKIWTPLHTTASGSSRSREEGSGTGLGLSIIYSVVRELKGRVNVIGNDKELGGAKFIIWIPQKKEEDD